MGPKKGKKGGIFKNIKVMDQTKMQTKFKY